MKLNVLPQVKKAGINLKILRAALIILIAANISFIWYNSAKPASDSNVSSKSISESVAPYVVKNFNEMPKKQQKSEISKLNDKLRQCAHAVEFIPLGLLSLAFLISVFELNRKKKFFGNALLLALMSVAFALLCALTDEVHQIFVDGRAFELNDIAADMSGSAIGILAVLLGLCVYYFLAERKKPY